MSTSFGSLTSLPSNQTDADTQTSMGRNKTSIGPHDESFYAKTVRLGSDATLQLGAFYKGPLKKVT
jgi:hypothetical protein